VGWAVLKRRIIPVELLLGGRLVKTVRFDTYRDVGDPVKSSQVYSDQDADELILLNIARDLRSPAVSRVFLKSIAESCYVPIAAGGGIGSVEDAAALFEVGADKVVVNSAAYARPTLLSEIADRFGSQAVVASIDAARSADNSFALRSDCGRRAEMTSLEQHIVSVIEHGAGEVLINSVDRDGAMSGYDLELIRRTRAACTVPLIVCGGAGHYLHLKEALDLGADAVACGSLFNFGDNNPLRAKSFLKNHQIPLKRI